MKYWLSYFSRAKLDPPGALFKTLSLVVIGMFHFGQRYVTLGLIHMNVLDSKLLCLGYGIRLIWINSKDFFETKRWNIFFTFYCILFRESTSPKCDNCCQRWHKLRYENEAIVSRWLEGRDSAPLRFDTASMTITVIIGLGRAAGPHTAHLLFTNNTDRYPVAAAEVFITTVSETDN